MKEKKNSQEIKGCGKSVLGKQNNHRKKSGGKSHSVKNLNISQIGLDNSSMIQM